LPSVNPDARVGKQLKFGKGLWTVVGVFEAGEARPTAKYWGDLNQISSDFDRSEGLSSVLVRAQDRASVKAIIQTMEDDPKLGLEGLSEVDYYKAQTASGAPSQVSGDLHCHHHGRRIELRGNEYDVRGSLAPSQRNRNATSAGVLAGQHPV